MRTVVDAFRDAIVQIATPHSAGTGFYLHEAHLIVTNEHIVRDNREVVVQGNAFDKQLSEVRYTDENRDLAFIAPPRTAPLPVIRLGDESTVKEGDAVVSIGHPFGLEFSVTQGVISNVARERNGLLYLQHDAALNPGNSGGPLISTSGGQVIGVNTFGMKDGDNIGFSLPASTLKEALEKFRTAPGQVKACCRSCGNVVSEITIADQKYCPHCGAKVKLAIHAREYEPGGIAGKIEDLLRHIGHEVRLARRAPNSWEIQQGTARINITYHEDTGLIMGDAHLCKLPPQNIRPIYELLLRQNYQLKGLTFSIKDQDIVLSLLIFDRHLNLETGSRLFRHLFERADYFDNLLVEEYGALWAQQ